MSDALALIAPADRQRLDALAGTPAPTDAVAAARVADDLAFVQSIRLAVERARGAALTPLRRRLEEVRGAYDDLLAPVVLAEGRLKAGLLSYRAAARAAAQQAAERAVEAEARLAAAVARQDAEHAGLPPAEVDAVGDATAAVVRRAVAEQVAPAEPPRVVAGDVGTAALRVRWTFAVTDPALVPREYLMVNERAIREAVQVGVREIPGVAIRPVEGIVGRARR